MTSETVLPEIPIEPPLPEHPAWNLLDVAGIAFSALVGIFITAIVAMVVITVVKHGTKLNPAGIAANPFFFLPVQIGSYGIGALVAVTVVHWRSRIPFLSAIRWNRGAARVEFVLAGFLIAMAVLMAQRFIHMPKNLPIEKYFNNAHSAWMLSLFGILVAPFIEEMFFRGLLFPALGRTFARRRDMSWLAILLLSVAALYGAYVHLRWHLFSRAALGMAFLALALLVLSRVLPQSTKWDRGVPLVLAIVFTSAMFSLVHQAQLAGASGPLAILFCVGLILTIVRYKTDSVCASWMVHISYNATLFTVMLIATDWFRKMPS